MLQCLSTFSFPCSLCNSFPSLLQETSTYQAEVTDQRRQLEKQSAVRLELEDKIMIHMQQKLTHNKAAKYSQRLTSKMTTLKKEKVKMGFRKVEKAFRTFQAVRKHCSVRRCRFINMIVFNIYSIFLELQFQTGLI